MKLIILNGCPAAGKSTVAKKLHEDLPLSLLADVDSWRQLISGWRENREESLKLTYKFTVAAVSAHLQAGYDVIVDKAILGDDGVIEGLIESGKTYGAEIHEFILTANKDTIIKRAGERGFHKNGLLTPERVLYLWDLTQELLQTKSGATAIDTGILSA